MKNVRTYLAVFENLFLKEYEGIKPLLIVLSFPEITDKEPYHLMFPQSLVSIICYSRFGE